MSFHSSRVSGARPAMPTFQSLAMGLDGSVGYLGLDRPETLNAFDESMIEDITAAAAWFSDCSEVQAVVIHSTARAFSSGFHLSLFADASPSQAARVVEAGRRMIEAVSTMRPITVAAANGHCVGGGLVLMAACDFRYVSDNLSVYLPETRLGIPLAWGGVTRLVREIGPAATAELVLLCERVGPEKLKELGIVNAIVPESRLMTHAEETARRLCELSPLVLETTKKQIGLAMKALAPADGAVLEENVVHAAMGDETSAARRAAYLDSLR